MNRKNPDTPGKEELKHYLDMGLEIIVEAEDVLIKAKKRGFSHRLKSVRSVVTDVVFGKPDVVDWILEVISIKTDKPTAWKHIEKRRNHVLSLHALQ